jgi:thiamine biosynthesis lipoprotein
MSNAVVEKPVTSDVRRHVEHVMGMPISLALRGRHASSDADSEAWQAVITELRDVDAIFSTYRHDSIISRLGRGELEINDCPPEVAEVFELAREAEQVSDGAFSIHLQTLDGAPRLDPSGVVKGWAVQRASRFLTALDDIDFCLSAGGDMVCHTTQPDGSGWRIGIENPRDPSRLIAMVPIRSGAVATSGTAHRGDHLIDPRTGQSPDGIASVTVIAGSLTWADIDATAAYVMGRDAPGWLQTRSIQGALIVWADGTSCRLPKTS